MPGYGGARPKQNSCHRDATTTAPPLPSSSSWQVYEANCKKELSSKKTNACLHGETPPACWACGCSSRFSADGERVCWCATCHDTGCDYDYFYCSSCPSSPSRENTCERVAGGDSSMICEGAAIQHGTAETALLKLQAKLRGVRMETMKYKEKVEMAELNCKR